MRTIAIAGASGFIGQHLLKHYLEEDNHILAIVPDPENLEKYKDSGKLEIVKAGFEDFDKISDMTETRDINIFYYLSWGGYGKATNDYAAQIQNIKPICDAVNEAAKMGCKRFLFSTSFSEYMISEKETLRHNDGAHCNVYGAAKQAARVMAHATAAQKGVPFLCVAFANTFGVGDNSHRSTNLFVHKLLKGDSLDLTEGKHLYDWNYIEDTIAGLVLAGEKGIIDSVYYIGSNERRPLKDIVSDVRYIICHTAEVRLGTYHEDFHVDYTSVDVTKLYRDTGYQPKWKFEDAIKKTAEWVAMLDWQ